jgi:hypothetical protein
MVPCTTRYWQEAIHDAERPEGLRSMTVPLVMDATVVGSYRFATDADRGRLD